ncbi:hypothetical protein OFN64_35565, partial [Escherichia coli]|nr:hypothetical protein [Escherichia coli]
PSFQNLPRQTAPLLMAYPHSPSGSNSIASTVDLALALPTAQTILTTPAFAKYRAAVYSPYFLPTTSFTASLVAELNEVLRIA